MFYRTDANDHGLPHDPFKAIVAPRPVGWISTRNAAGAFNLSPYSFFNAVSTDPYLVWFSSEGEKDSVAFARETGRYFNRHMKVVWNRVLARGLTRQGKTVAAVLTMVPRSERLERSATAEPSARRLQVA